MADMTDPFGADAQCETSFSAIMTMPRRLERAFAYPTFMSAPDAQRSGSTASWREKRHAPRHAAVWVRTEGTWRRGKIIEWVTELSSGIWDLVVVADEPQPIPWQGRFRFDPRSIKPRYHDDRPPA
jgi:hypothetical protein